MADIEYTLTAGSGVVRNADGAQIPADPLNVDWQNYQAWIAKGNTAAPYVAPAIPPNTVIGFISFCALFTPAEQQALFSSDDWQVKMLVAQATSAGPAFDLADPRIVAGVTALVSLLPTAAGFTAERATAVLANQQPGASN